MNATSSMSMTNPRRPEMANQLPDSGMTGKARTDGSKAGLDSHRELPINPKRPGPNLSHPDSGNSSEAKPKGGLTVSNGNSRKTYS